MAGGEELGKRPESPKTMLAENMNGEIKKEDDEDEKLNPADEDENEGVPVDSGFAWVITLNVFLIQTVIFGFSRSLSVLLLDITEEFDSSLTVVSLCFTVFTLTSSVASLVVSNVLMARYSIRTISLVGSLLSAVSVILMAVAPNISAFLTIFIIKGSSFSALLVCPTSLVGYYFKARRGLASSLCNTGFCVAYIIFPPLAEVLRSAYGLRGCLLILGAIELNLVAFSMLLVPPALFKKIYHARRRAAAQRNGSILPESNHTMTRGGGDYSAKPDTKYGSKQEGTYDTSNADSIKHNIQEGEEHGDENLKLIISDSARLGVADPGDVILSSSPKSMTSLSPPASPVWSDTGNSVGNAGKVTFGRQRSFYTSRQSLAIHSVPYFPPDLDEADFEGSVKKPEINKNWKYYLDKVCDTSLFKIYSFRMFVVFSPLATFVVYLLTYMPLIATMAGLSKSDGAFLMTISGFMDLLARLVLSLLADFEWFSKSKVVAFSLAVLGVTCHGARIIDSYNLFLGFAIIFGLFGGVRQTLTSVMILEYVGMEKFAKALGFLATVCTLVLSVNHPIVGGLLDVTGSFVIPLHYVGTVIFISVVVILTEPCCLHLDEKRLKSEMAAEERRRAGIEAVLEDKV